MKSTKCRVCGAENPPDVEFCESCGVKIAAPSASEGRRADKMLEELTEVSPEESARAAGERGKESLDVEKELVDELLDSLLIEEGATGAEEFECPLCGTPLPVNAEVCVYCGARFAKVEAGKLAPGGAPKVLEEAPVSVAVTEEDTSGIKVSHGRLIDITVLGTIVGLIIIFLAGGMYSATSIGNNPASLVAFIMVAIIGLVVCYVILQISTSAIAQGDKLVKEGNYQDALYYYDRAIRMGSRPASAWASKGVALKRMGKFEEALHCQNAAIKLDPENEIAWCNKGDIYFKLNSLGKAVECYNKAIELKPKYAIAWNNKGAALAMARRFKEAKDCHDKAVRLKPKYVAAWLNRGEVLAKLGQRDEAARCLERARALGA